MRLSALPAIELDMAVAVARGFYLGEDPVSWSDHDIAATADTVAEAGGLDRDEIAILLVRERDARGRRH